MLGISVVSHLDAGACLVAIGRRREPTRRRELLHALALLQKRELRDQNAAIATWRAAAAEDPRDLVAHDALVAAFSDAGDWASVYQELSRVAPHLDGDRKVVVALRLAEVALQRGDHPLALTHYRELLAISELSDDVLATVEQLAREQADGSTRVSYPLPSAVFRPYGDARIDAMAQELDPIFERIVRDATEK